MATIGEISSIPPIGGMLDISPIVAIILLQILQGFVVGTLSKLGL